MKKGFDLIFKDLANNEVVEAFQYYEDQLEGLGERFLIELDNAIVSINRTPNGFQNFHNGTKQIPLEVFPYVVIYKLEESTLVIFAVFQTHRNPKGKLR